ncbi:MAG: xylan 1,4-beta-xylosidase [Clostridia bacterium]|nr:xylan 1,4-beta-xylosidase [Clostridia bacterium]
MSGGAFDACQCRVLVDRETGVNYLWTASGYAGGLTVLLDAEGKPVVTSVPADDEE